MRMILEYFLQRKLQKRRLVIYKLKLNKGKGPESKIQVLREHAHQKVFGRTGDASSY